MIKRIVLGLLLALGISRGASAALVSCETKVGQCNYAPNGPCDWNTAANWVLTSDHTTACGAAPNNGANTYSVTIRAGDSVVLSTDGIVIGDSANAAVPLTLNGTLIFDNSASNRDGSGFRTLTIKANNAGNSGVAIQRGAASILRMRHGDQIKFDTTGGVAGILDSSGTAIWDAKGEVVQTTIDATTAQGADAVCPAATYVELTLHNYIPQARVGRRIRFENGQLRDWEEEIRKVTGNKVGFCAGLADGSSTGERLDGHVATPGKFPDSTPTANTRGWSTTDTLVPCTGAMAPHMYCTGAGAGTAIVAVPAKGDTVSIIDDVWFTQSAGTKGIYFTQSNITSATAFPSFYATNWNGVASILITAPNLGGTYYPGRDFSYNNIHDFVDPSAWGNAGVIITGFSDFNIFGNSIHDQVPGTAEAVGIEVVPGTNNVMRNINIVGNHLYRTKNDAIVVSNNGVTTPSLVNVDVFGNRTDELCTTTAAEDCNDVEVDCSQNVRVHNNLMTDTITQNQGQGFGIRFGGPGTASSACHVGNVAYDNIISNAYVGIQCDAQNSPNNGNQCGNVTATRNYISNTLLSGITGVGNNYSNYVRMYGVKGVAAAAFFLTPRAYGNFAEYRDVAGVGSVGYAFNIGFDSGVMNNNPSIILRDNIAAVNGATSSQGIIQIYGDERGTISIDHQTLDGGGAFANIFGIDFNAWAPGVVSTTNVTDLLAGQLDAGFVGRCDSGTANTHEVYGSWFGGESSVSAEDTGSSGFSNQAGCFSVGTRLRYDTSGRDSSTPPWVDRANLDFNIPSTSPLASAGVGGSAIGARGFLFNRSALDGLWGSVIPWDLCAGGTSTTLCMWPKDVANGSCTAVLNGQSVTEPCNTDTDGDGVLDIHDNCPTVPNPSQLDSNVNGVGDACDN